MTPIQELLLISIGVSFLYALSYRLLTDPQEMRRIKAEMKSLRERRVAALKAGRAEEAAKAGAEMMKLQGPMLRSTMKPALVSLMAFFLLINPLGAFYGKLLLALPFTMPLPSLSFPFIAFRDSIGWFWWYILVTLPFTFLFRKLLGAE